MQSEYIKLHPVIRTEEMYLCFIKPLDPATKSLVYQQICNDAAFELPACSAGQLYGHCYVVSSVLEKYC